MQPHRLSRIRAATIALVTLVVTGASARPVIIAGTDAISDQFPEVFALTYGSETSTDSKNLCTAVLVKPRVLITSAHCLPEDPTEPVFVSEGVDRRAPSATYRSVLTVRNETYFTTKSEIQRSGFDIGVVILAEDVPGADLVTGAKLARLGSIETDLEQAYRDGVIVVGYGGKRNLFREATNGVQRWATARLGEAIENAFTTLGPKAAVSYGDSGGPAFVVDADGKRRLIGIASCAPDSEKLGFTGLPETSLYTGMRPKLANWITSVSSSPEFGAK